MRINKRNPDFILILGVLVCIGVVVTMKAQAGAESGAVNKIDSKTLHQKAWTKDSIKINQQIIRN